MNARLADRYRVGHVFPIGDAAHIHSPTRIFNSHAPSSGSPGYKLSARIDGRRMTRVRLAGPSA
jgi:hypothetical protein